MMYIVEHGGTNLFVHDGVAGGSSKFIALRRLNAGRLMIWNQRLALVGTHQNDDEDGKGVETQEDMLKLSGRIPGGES